MRVLRFIPIIGLFMLAGCGKFFVPNSGGGGCTTNCVATDFMYVANQSTTAPSLAAFTFASGTLAAATSTPYTLSVLPSSIVINPANTFLYVGSLSGSIFLYTINSDGTLTAQNNNNPVASTVGVAAMKIDSTGAYLLVANAGSLSMSVFSINSSTGALTLVGASLTLQNGNATGTTLNHLLITPNNQYVYVSQGTSGVDILTFSSATGVLTEVGHLNSGNSATNSDQGLASDPSSQYLFVTETGVNAVRVLSIGTNGALKEVSGSPFKTGLGPSAVMVDPTGTYVYATNRTDNTISGFTLTATTGALAALPGSPYATGKTPVDIVEDNTKTYVATVNSGGSNDLAVFKFSTTSPGDLGTFANATTGTDPTIASAIAATH